jgi:hypothetical protein
LNWSLLRLIQPTNAFIDIDIHRMKRAIEVRTVKQAARRFDIAFGKSIVENRMQIFNAEGRWLKAGWVIKGLSQRASMDSTPAVAQGIGWAIVQIKAAVAILQGSDNIMLAFHKQVHRLAAKLLGMEAVKEDGATAALSVANFSGENGGISRFITAFSGEEIVAQFLYKKAFDCLGRT